MVNEMILSGLLHDIGKFMQRAFEGMSTLSPQSRNMENMLCPLWEGRHSHYHVLFTNEFCEQYLSNLPAAFDSSLVANLASYHHKPSNDAQRIIQEADHLSSGMDRREDDSPSGSQRFRKVRLRAITSMIDIGKGSDATHWNHALQALAPSAVFPRMEDGEGQVLTNEYHTLWTGFLEQWKENRVRDPWGFINRVLSILERYTWCIPSATNVLPDISLFDHSKTTAAIAACLYSSPDKEQPFLLTAGDFSGIQKYIFDIKKGEGGYAKRLRARSYYVSLLSDAVSLKILRALGLPLTQRILFAGGKFHLLLPHSEETVRTVTNIRAEIDHWLMKKTGGDIRFSLAQRAVSAQGILKFSETLTSINHLLREDKDRAYRSILQRDSAWIPEMFMGDTIHTGESSGVCVYCGKRIGNKRNDDYICSSCDLDMHLGTKLPQAQSISFFENMAGREIIPGISIELSRSYPTKLSPGLFLVRNFSGAPETGAPPELPFMAGFAVNYIPRDGDEPITFDDLAAQAKGQPRLAYLKGDVDNLGYVFSQGFISSASGETSMSISRIATLSRTLELFFSGHFRHLLETDSRFRYIYTVYAGGDDFLCLGPWDIMIEFAQQLREDFARFTCENPNWSMSMGLALAGNHTPVLEGTEQAEAHLEVSKLVEGSEPIPTDMSGKNDLKKNATGCDGEIKKDRFTLFGTSIPFASFPQAYEQAQQVAGWLQGEEQTLSSAQVWRLRRYGERYRQWLWTKNTQHLEYIPLLAYDLRRNWTENSQKRREAKEWASTLISAPDMPDMRTLKFTCEYALIANRVGSNEKRR